MQCDFAHVLLPLNKIVIFFCYWTDDTALSVSSAASKKNRCQHIQPVRMSSKNVVKLVWSSDTDTQKLRHRYTEAATQIHRSCNVISNLEFVLLCFNLKLFLLQWSCQFFYWNLKKQKQSLDRLHPLCLAIFSLPYCVIQEWMHLSWLFALLK